MKSSRVQDPVFELTEMLITSLTGILTVATNNGQLIWNNRGGNFFSATFCGLAVSWDRSDNKPPTLIIGSGEKAEQVQDNGSYTYGFCELQNAIQTQYVQYRNQEKRCKGFHIGGGVVIKCKLPAGHQGSCKIAEKTKTTNSLDPHLYCR